MPRPLRQDWHCKCFDIIFEDTVSKIVFTYCLSDEERAVFRMEQMKFLTKNIDDFKKIKTKSGYLFGIGAMQWYTDGGQEPTYAGVQSNNGGIWITPDSIRAYIQKLPKEE